MGNFLIRDLPPALKAKISRAANSNGRSMSEEVKAKLLEDYDDVDSAPVTTAGSAFDEIRAVFADTLMTDEEHEEFMRVIEASRKDFGRVKMRLALQEIEESTSRASS
jgi:plasmid stability protein